MSIENQSVLFVKHLLIFLYVAKIVRKALGKDTNQADKTRHEPVIHLIRNEF